MILQFPCNLLKSPQEKHDFILRTCRSVPVDMISLDSEEPGPNCRLIGCSKLGMHQRSKIAEACTAVYILARSQSLSFISLRYRPLY